MTHTLIPLTPIGFHGPDAPPQPLLDACVHCGLCLTTCPTYRATGLEMFSPRGRLYLMRSVAEGRIGMESAVFQEQISACLNCRACEAVCPSGVQYGAILEAARAQLEQARSDGRLPAATLPVRVIRGAVFDRLFRDMRLFRGFSRLIWLYQKTGVQALARRLGLLRLLGMADAERLLPQVSNTFVVPRDQILPAIGKQRAQVALVTGCIMATAFANVHAATVRVLRRNGCTVVLPANQECCGALHSHGGDLEGARALARQNIAAFERMAVDAIVVNAAGCGSTLKEYGHLLHTDPVWAHRAHSFSQKVKDISEFLVGLGLRTDGMRPLYLDVTYQEPCHLAHAQRITAAPRTILKHIPGLRLHEMPESAMCCGSAGVYNVTQPAMAAQLGQRKITNALTTPASVIATSNPGCHLQLVGELNRRGQHIQVRHIMELLDAAMTG